VTAAGAPAEWVAGFRALRDGVRADVASVAELRAVTDRRGELERLLADLDGQLERVAHAAVITLVGATGAGKSALLNALVGRPVAREGIDRPTTREPVIYAPRDADLSELLAGCADGDDGGSVRPVVVRSDPSAISWTGHVLVDAPDLNSVAERHRRVVTALAERSDVLVVVLHRQSVVEELPVSFLDAFARRRALLFVLNRIDELTVAAREALRAQVRALVDSRWQATAAPVVAVSARSAQRQPAADEFVALQEALRQMVNVQALDRVRRQNAVGTAALIASIFQHVSADVSADLDALPAEVEHGAAALARRLADETAARWGLQRPDLGHLLWAEAGKRWDGPGGWSLRVGGLSSVGFGAGALLARRHPLLAAGAAVGGATAEQLQQASVRREMAAGAELLPAASDLAAWYADGLSGARVRAARLTGAPESLGIPSADAVYTAAIDIVRTAWQRLVNRELPAAAERSLLRLLRWPLDLPVYALAVVILYRVAVGFRDAQYVGVDFLVNAGLLAAAYLFCVGFVVRRGLRWRCRRLVSRAITECCAAMDGWVERTCKTARQRSAEKRAVLQRLAQLESRWRQALEGGEDSAPHA
jgi:predicted GTPase